MTEIQLADWESATVQNLGPLLDDAATAALWETIVANRATPSPSAFLADATERFEKLEKTPPVDVLLPLTLAASQLRDLLAAGSPAKD